MKRIYIQDIPPPPPRPTLKQKLMGAEKRGEGARLTIKEVKVVLALIELQDGFE